MASGLGGPAEPPAQCSGEMRSVRKPGSPLGHASSLLCDLGQVTFPSMGLCPKGLKNRKVLSNGSVVIVLQVKVITLASFLQEGAGLEATGPPATSGPLQG